MVYWRHGPIHQPTDVSRPPARPPSHHFFLQVGRRIMRSSSYTVAFAFTFVVSRPASPFVAPARWTERARSGGIVIGIRALDASSPRDDDISGGDDHRDCHDDDGTGGGFDIGGAEMEVEEEPLNRIFQRGVVLQRMGDRAGCLREYERFLGVAEYHDVDPSLYAEVHANVGAMYAMEVRHTTDATTDVGGRRAELRRKARDSLSEAVRCRPGLGSAWVNLALLTLSEGREMTTTTSTSTSAAAAGGNDDNDDDDDDEERPLGAGGVERCLKEARQCCERAMGMDNDDERSRALANKLIGDIDAMMKQRPRRRNE